MTDSRNIRDGIAESNVQDGCHKVGRVKHDRQEQDRVMHTLPGFFHQGKASAVRSITAGSGTPCIVLSRIAFSRIVVILLAGLVVSVHLSAVLGILSVGHPRASIVGILNDVIRDSRTRISLFINMNITGLNFRLLHERKISLGNLLLKRLIGHILHRDVLLCGRIDQVIAAL